MTHSGGVPLVATLRRLLRPAEGPGGRPRCELCGDGLATDHGHVVDIRSRRLLCACTGCRHAGGAYRPMLNRYLHRPSMKISPDEWDALGIPVGLVFFFFNSGLGRIVACYPGPAGATESVLPLEAWASLAGANPWMSDLEPDVEGLLVRGTDREYQCFIVPIDVCYELVGRMRNGWRGWSGGDTLRTEIDRFFDTIAEKSAAGFEPETSCAEGRGREQA